MEHSSGEKPQHNVESERSTAEKILEFVDTLSSVRTKIEQLEQLVQSSSEYKIHRAGAWLDDVAVNAVTLRNRIRDCIEALEGRSHA